MCIYIASKTNIKKGGGILNIFQYWDVKQNSTYHDITQSANQ